MIFSLHLSLCVNRFHSLVSASALGRFVGFKRMVDQSLSAAQRRERGRTRSGLSRLSSKDLRSLVSAFTPVFTTSDETVSILLTAADGRLCEYLRPLRVPPNITTCCEYVHTINSRFRRRAKGTVTCCHAHTD